MLMRTAALSALALLAAGGPTAANAASGSGGSGGSSRTEVRVAGTCTAGATSKLKAKQRDGRLEIEFEVDANVIGQAWGYTLAVRGTPVASGTALTTAPSGSFTVRTIVRDLAGADTVTAAASTAAGRTCSAGLTI